MIFTNMIFTGGNGNNVQEQQNIKLSASSTPPVTSEHLETNSQMELVGHSIVRLHKEYFLKKLFTFCMNLWICGSLFQVYADEHYWLLSADVDIISVSGSTLWGSSDLRASGKYAAWSLSFYPSSLSFLSSCVCWASACFYNSLIYIYMAILPFWKWDFHFVTSLCFFVLLSFLVYVAMRW